MFLTNNPYSLFMIFYDSLRSYLLVPLHPKRQMAHGLGLLGLSAGKTYPHPLRIYPICFFLGGKHILCFFSLGFNNSIMHVDIYMFKNYIFCRRVYNYSVSFHHLFLFGSIFLCVYIYTGWWFQPL